MTCKTCSDAREAPAHVPFFTDGCLYCAARRIQFIQRRMNLAPQQRVERCRKALAQAMDWGLPEPEIRAMAKQEAWAVEPQPERKKK